MIKLVLVGLSGIGKSNLAKYLAYERKVDEEYSYMPTIGADIMYIKNKNICIYDMAGQPRFERVSESFVRKADIIAFCFSRDDSDSYQYINELYKKYSHMLFDKIVLYVETKCDLEPFVNHEVIVDKQCILQTSSKTGFGREEILKLLEEHNMYEEEENLVVTENQFCGNCEIM